MVLEALSHEPVGHMNDVAHTFSVHELAGNFVRALWPSEVAALRTAASAVRETVSGSASRFMAKSECYTSVMQTLEEVGCPRPAEIVTAGLMGSAMPWPSWRDALLLLLYYGCDIHAQGEALNRALRAQDTFAVAWLLAASADPEEPVEADLTPLRWAARAGKECIVQALLDAGASVNNRGRYGYTALMAAAMHGQSRVVDILLCAGAVVNTNGDGETAIDLAHSSPDIVRVLEDHVKEHGWASGSVRGSINRRPAFTLYQTWQGLSVGRDAASDERYMTSREAS